MLFLGLGDFRGLFKVWGSLGLFLGFGKVRAVFRVRVFWADFWVIFGVWGVVGLLLGFRVFFDFFWVEGI